MLSQYHVELGEVLYRELAKVAATRDMPVADLVRRFIKLGLVAARLEDAPDSKLIIREGKRERELVV